jgi:glycosyltransferase involved in cell wall biosynthesis
MGCSYTETHINRRSINPLPDFILFLKYLNIIKKENPEIVLTYTIKPNIYGGIACRLLNTPYIANITGLGTAIENGGVLQKFILFLYKFALKNASCVFLQNKEDAKFLNSRKIINGKQRIIPGSGVNTEEFTHIKYPKEEDCIRFLFIGRIMKAKGINELLKAVKIIRKMYPNVEFHLIGFCEEERYCKILNELNNLGIICYHGWQDDVHRFIKNSHATILPSYHEGTSNVLLESASSGRPVLASRVPGCIETFDEEISGFGFISRSVDSLVETIIRFIELPHKKKEQMGIAGRRKMEKEYNRKIVTDAYMEQISN